MVRIVVLADTHVQGWQELPAPMRQAVENVDWVVHCGDYTGWELLQEIRRRAKRFRGVYGNVDGTAIREELPQRAILEVEGKKIGITHPSWGGPPFAPHELLSDFPQVDVILFGHLHQRVNMAENQTLLLSPGQGYGSFSVLASYALLVIDESHIEAEIKSVS